MKLQEDCAARVTLPLDPTLRPMVTGPTRAFLRLHRLPRAAARFISRRVTTAVERLTRFDRRDPVRVRLTLRSRAGRLQVALRVTGEPQPDRILASLTRGAPAAVLADYRSGRRGATLSFVTAVPGAV